MRPGLAALLSVGCLMDGCLDQGAPWYWPVGPVFGSRRILQSYGQYEDVYGAHDGLDISGVVDEDVRAPIDGVVDKIFPPNGGSYGSVVLSNGSYWRLSVTHLYDIVPQQGDAVRKGQRLGRVVSWKGKPAGYTHVHLGLFEWTGKPSPDRIYLDNPMAYLGGRTDSAPPFFRPIEDGQKSHWPAAFIDDSSTATGLVFHDHDALPLGRLDIVVRAGDYFPVELLLAVPTIVVSGATPILYGVEILPVTLLDPMNAHARLSVRITHEPPKEAKCERVLERTIDFQQGITDDAYLDAALAWPIASKGWPKPDYFFVVTHTATSVGTWDTAVAGPGKYRVEVTAEDVAGNIAAESFLVIAGNP
jgi:hypothetical protein